MKPKAKKSRTQALRDFSPITWVFERLLRLLQFLPPQVLIGNRVSFQSRPNWNPMDPWQTVRRSRQIEIYVAIWILVELFLIIIQKVLSVSPWWVRVPACLRIIDILQVTANVSIFDQLRAPRTHVVASLVRILVLTFINFIELMTCFGILYLTILDQLTCAKGWYDAFYFSVITQLTIGYGDIKPTGVAKGLAILQGVSGVVFVVLVLGRVVSLLPKLTEVMGKTKSMDHPVRNRRSSADAFLPGHRNIHRRRHRR